MVVWYSFSTEGFLVAGVVFLVLYLVDTVPLFDLRTEGALETEKSPVPVREKFEELLNPIAAFPVAWADEIHEESTDGGGATAVLKGTLLKLFRREYSLHVTRTNDDSVQIQFGEDEAAVKLSIAPSDDGTRVTVTSSHERERLLGLLYLVLQSPFEQRVLKHFGSQSVENSTKIDFRFG